MIDFQSTTLEEHLGKTFAQHDEANLMLIEFNH